MKTQPLHALFGAEVLDFNPVLAKEIHPEQKKSLRELLYQNELLLIRGHALTEQGLIELAKCFGQPVPFPIQKYRHAQYPEILISSNESHQGKPLGISRVGTFWHSDSSFSPRPPAVTVLQGKTVPNIGGETFFVSMTDSYRRLPENVQTMLKDRTSVHTIRKRYKIAEQDVGRSIAELHEDLKIRHPDTTHPIILTHPHTQKKALYFSEGYTLHIHGLKPTEHAELFEFLDAHSTQEEFTYRHIWEKNDILIWDNRSLNHKATTSPKPRTMFRVAVTEEIT